MHFFLGLLQYLCTCIYFFLLYPYSLSSSNTTPTKVQTGPDKRLFYDISLSIGLKHVLGLGPMAIQTLKGVLIFVENSKSNIICNMHLYSVQCSGISQILLPPPHGIHNSAMILCILFLLPQATALSQELALPASVRRNVTYATQY